MRLAAALAAHEVRFQRRSLRFRSFAVGYLALGCLPALLIHLRREQIDYLFGGSTFAGETFAVLPFLTALLAGLLSLDGINRERSGGAWTTATLTGVSNAGYLVRRWIALLVVLLPLTAVPPAVAAALAWADKGSALVPAAFFGPWLLHVVPVAMVVSALALGLGTIGGNAASTFVLILLVLGVVPALGNTALDRFRLRFESPDRWLGMAEAGTTVARIQKVFRTNDPWWTFPLPDSEAGYDLGTAAEQELAEGLLLAAAAAAALGAAVFFLRRTRPDVRPQRIRPDHPLRNFLVSFGRLREQYTPDRATAPADLALFALALLAAAGAVALQVGRAVHYERLAEERWRAETGTAAVPTLPDVVPVSWRIEGGFTAAGTVDVRVAGTVHNTGQQTRGHLAFSLAHGLEAAEVSADRGRAVVRRAWDRLTVDLEPPIPPGGRRALRFHLTGRPAEPEFGLALWRGDQPSSFTTVYEQHRKARFGHDRSDLSQSFTVPAVSGFRVALDAPCLTPVLRYTPWALDGGFVPAEVYFPIAQVELSLRVPRNLLVADSCGGLSAPAGMDREPGRLESRCALPLSELAVMGGRQRLLQRDAGGKGTAVAVFPAHRAAGELHLGFLKGGARMVDEAWPGMGGLSRTVILEWPTARVHDGSRMSRLYSRYRDPFESWVKVIGNLVFLEESDLIGIQGLQPEPMVAEIISARLARRRRLDPDQSMFFRQLFRQIVLQRLGLGPQSGAVVGPMDRQYLPFIHEPALHPEHSMYWSLRFPSLVAALSRRTGAEALRGAVEELLAPGGDHADRPATFAEFAAILERRSERPVAPMIRDFFLAASLPEPVLDDVELHPAADGWRVTGKVHNEADGEALCRLVLTTDVGPVETEVRIGTGETLPFSLATTHRPLGVFLDPDHECHRLVYMGGARDRVYLQGGKK